MARPIDPAYPVNQAFGGYATRGVIGRWGGSEIETLVAMYGDYQPYGHAGADIACPIGTPVYAIADGVVVYAGWGEDLPGDESWGPAGYFQRWGLYKYFPGIVTVIKHPQLGKYSIYGHLSSNDEAPAGTAVSDGQVIAKSGNTKTRTDYVGPHLHVAMLADPVNYSTGGGLIFGCEDPVPYFNTGSLSYAGSTITPVQEDDMANVSDEQLEFIIKSLESLVNNVATKKDVASPGQIAFTEAALRSLVQNVATKADLSGVSAAVATAVGAKATTEEIRAAVEAGMSAGLKVNVTVEGASE